MASNEIVVDGKRYTARRSHYQSNDGLYIGLFDEEGFPECDMSVNLEAYGVKLQSNQIAVNHELVGDKALMVAFAKAFCVIPEDGMAPVVTYGPFGAFSPIFTIKDLSLIPEM